MIWEKKEWLRAADPEKAPSRDPALTLTLTPGTHDCLVILGVGAPPCPAILGFEGGAGADLGSGKRPGHLPLRPPPLSAQPTLR